MGLEGDWAMAEEVIKNRSTRPAYLRRGFI
jgi:hypothetical protein